MSTALKAADGLGWYGGINIGQSMADIDRGRIRSGLLSGGLTTTTINVAKSWQFSRLVFGEIAWELRIEELSALDVATPTVDDIAQQFPRAAGKGPP